MKNWLISTFLTLTLLGVSAIANGQNQSIQEDVQRLTIEVENFLKEQSQGLKDPYVIEVKPIDPRLKLTPCSDLKSFLPAGAKVWGKVTVGLRCSAPKGWVIYVAAQVRVYAEYFVSKNPLNAGQTLSEEDLLKIRGEISNQPMGTITDKQQAIGKTMLATHPAGVTLRHDLFKSVPVILQGQSIKVISQGPGFRVSNDAIAIQQAIEGQLIRAKTLSGQFVSGIARSGGFIEVQ
ncbi:flagellar basal body P-ring formation chaperone FlgA [Undibacterium fentianense]|uniref:Flagella basal body P-ring formation protein FlgA n=1 Tax=Undibacterium fentianense TaxID=2828728 RepID=A0A941DWS5_9BURK|nr:flagellar basal body P-ring formation chaperone FlgA [Undibacterium fentianense]MBR7798789.1 flagellar basal body P-ring formation protein FlgA [Undibacterium fentianense]